MTTIQAFETALKDVVNAKRLSESKMTTLRDVALNCMENDTQMVSVLYRTHKGLSANSKIWSLYAFDALARAARHQVNKSHIVADVNAARGNCATFLLKIEGILDGLFRDIASSGFDGLKEKAKKILDIWAKSNTFSSAVLSPLHTLLRQTEYEKETDNAVQLADPPPNNVLPIPPAQPNVAPLGLTLSGNENLQSTLLALLSKAASVSTVTPPAMTYSQMAPVGAPPVLDASQLALLQHLAQTASAQGISADLSAQPVPVVPAPVMPVVGPVRGGPAAPPQTQPPPYRDDLYGPPSAHAPRSELEQQQPRYGAPPPTPDRGYPRTDYDHENRRSNQTNDYDYNHNHDYDYTDARREYSAPTTLDPHRGGGRGGGFRDRDRGGGGPGGRGRGRGRWDAHDRGGGNRERDFDGPRSRDDRSYYDDDHASRGRRSSRSRSPPGRFRGGGRRGGRGMNGRGQMNSPPLRGSYRDGRRSHEDEGSGYGRRYTYASEEPGLDEFGREIRADSPSDQVPRAHEDSPLPPGSASVTASDRESTAPDIHSPSIPPMTPSGTSLNANPYSQAYPDQTSQSYGVSSEPSTSTSAPAGTSTQTTHSAPHGGGLDTFDRASFDPAQPASWEALGQAWIATHGSPPSQEQLMQFVFAGMSLPVPANAGGGDSAGPGYGSGADYGQPDEYGNAAAGGSPQQSRRQQTYRDDDRWDDQAGGMDGQRGGWAGRGGGYGGRGRGFGRGRGGGGGGGGYDDGGRDGGDDYGRSGYGGRGRGGGYGQVRGDRGHHARRGRGDYHIRDEPGHAQGGYGRGEYGNGRGAYSAGGGYETDAVTLAGDGGGDDYSYSTAWQDLPQQQAPSPPTGSRWQSALEDEREGSGGEEGNAGGAAGKMQKVGDRWVFVRGAT